jgi:hypothetical protein
MIICAALPGTTTIRTTGTTISVFGLFAPIMPVHLRKVPIMIPVFYGKPDRVWV